jgi:hypothetical protein
MRDVVSTEDVCKKKVKDAVSFLEEDEHAHDFSFLEEEEHAMFTAKEEDDVKFTPFTSYLRMRNL